MAVPNLPTHLTQSYPSYRFHSFFVNLRFTRAARSLVMLSRKLLSNLPLIESNSIHYGNPGNVVPTANAVGKWVRSYRTPPKSHISEIYKGFPAPAAIAMALLELVEELIAMHRIAQVTDTLRLRELLEIKKYLVDTLTEMNDNRTTYENEPNK